MSFRKIILLTLIILTVGVIVLYSIRSTKASSGERLAKQYCASCHPFASPDLLTKQSWTYLLTYMGFYMGIRDYSYLQGSPKVVMDNIRSKEMTLVASNAFPAQPMVSQEEWKAIRKYYDDNAPENPLPQDKEKLFHESLQQFEVTYPSYQPVGAVVTMVRIDEKNQNISIANTRDQSLTFLNNELKVVQTYSGYDLLVDSYRKDNSLMLLSIGDLMGRYVGEGRGYIFHSKGPAQSLEKFSVVARNLQRPSSMLFHDFDNDGTDEILVSNFGDVTGNLVILKNDASGQYKVWKEIVSAPGIVKTAIHDFNKDGLPDIAVLMSHAFENVSIFYNQGDHNFKQEKVIEFNSAYGSTYFELYDFNGDGVMDIMTVNGDSDADPYNTLKKYHGIRIFINDGKNKFGLRYFYPMYGVHFAKACDFDQDGDPDIAAVSFFPDFNAEKQEVFTYLENKGEFNFELHTHHTLQGSRWMVMDIGDYDNDSDVDIVLGAAYIPLGMTVNHQEQFSSMSKTGRAVVVLKNKLR